ncbi:MAG: hypothetical protein GC155_18420 [Alphaproteobacteria bacterium]|nr:hypothetical protein [Alphaproteobacteria bacterium]
MSISGTFRQMCAVALTALLCGGNVAGAAPPIHSQSGSGETASQPASPLKLRLPILAVMTGVINRASYPIFEAATSGRDLHDDEWLGIGQNAIDLVGAASLITLPGTGQADAAWVADPNWLKLSADMQTASIAVGLAAANKDRAAMTESASRLAQSCQSCHIQFSARLLTAPPN